MREYPPPLSSRSNSCDALVLLGHRNTPWKGALEAHMTSAFRPDRRLVISTRYRFAACAAAAGRISAAATSAVAPNAARERLVERQRSDGMSRTPSWPPVAASAATTLRSRRHLDV